MHALAISAAGAAPSLIELDCPTPGVGEVLVRVTAASVNGFDLAVAGGMLEGMMEHRYPVVLGKDFAGTVDAVGTDVDGFAVGDRVFGVVTKDFLGDGSLGEYVTVPVSVGIAHTPGTITDQAAAGLGLAGATAVAAIDAAGLGAGSVVFVSGATGGVGTLVVQLAAQAGATVIATAKGEDASALVRDLGAHKVVDYTADIEGAVREAHPDGVDVIVHLAGDPATLLPTLRDGGRFVSALVMSADQLPIDNGAVIPVFAVPTESVLDSIAAAHADDTLRLRTDHVYPLVEAAAALTQFSTSKLGKIIVSVA